MLWKWICMDGEPVLTDKMNIPGKTHTQLDPHILISHLWWRGETMLEHNSTKLRDPVEQPPKPRSAAALYLTTGSNHLPRPRLAPTPTSPSCSHGNQSRTGRVPQREARLGTPPRNARPTWPIETAGPQGVSKTGAKVRMELGCECKNRHSVHFPADPLSHCCPTHCF